MKTRIAKRTVTVTGRIKATKANQSNEPKVIASNQVGGPPNKYSQPRTRIVKQKVKQVTHSLARTSFKLALEYIAEGKMVLTSTEKTATPRNGLVWQRKSDYMYYLSTTNIPGLSAELLDHNRWILCPNITLNTNHRYWLVNTHTVEEEVEVEITDNTLSYGEAIDYLVENVEGMVRVAIEAKDSAPTDTFYSTPSQLIVSRTGNMLARFHVQR